MSGYFNYVNYPVLFVVLNLSPILEIWSLPLANLPADSLPPAPKVSVTTIVF